MQRRWAKGKTLVALAFIMAGACWAGCGQPADEPAEPQSPPPSTRPAQAEPLPESPEPQIELTLTCPEEVEVGQEFVATIEVANRGRSPERGLSLAARPDGGLKPAGPPSPLESELGDLDPGRAEKIEVSLRAAAPGTFSFTAEVRRGEEVLASRWTVVTATGTAEEMPQPGPPTGPDLGPPLVENADGLQRLDPSDPVWFDKATNSVVLMGIVCLQEGALELFACLKGSKEHESVVTVPTKAYVVHAGLMAAGGEPGSPVRFDPDFAPPTGTEIEVRVIWKDAEGQTHSARGQDWVRNVRTGEAMSAPWVFAGSRFYENEETGERFYVADVEGDLICVANFPSAVLDVPVESTDSDASLLFDAFSQRIPPRGTPVTLVLTPKPE